MKIKIATDVHLFGADPSKVSLDELFKCDYLIGDIVDLKNTKEKSLNKALNVFKTLKDHFKARYITGNHECQKDKDIGVIYNGCLLIHGDRFFNGSTLSTQSRMHTLGAGMWKRLGKKLFSKARKFYDLHELTDEVLVRIDQEAVEFGVTKVICGHKHPKGIQVIDRSWGKLIILPRGISEIEL